MEGGDWFVVRSDTGEVVVNRSLVSLDHNQQLQLVIEARDRGMLPTDRSAICVRLSVTYLQTLLFKGRRVNYLHFAI